MQLMQGDCLERMKEIPDSSVDMVLVDPPYGTTSNIWDSIIPFEPMWDELHRCCKENAAMLFFSQLPFLVALAGSNIKEFRYEWIIEKPCATGFLNSKKMPLKAHENVLVFYKRLPTYNPQFGTGKPYVAKRNINGSTNYREFTREAISRSDGTRYPRDVLKPENLTGGGWNIGTKYHPTQKPVSILEYMIRTYTNEGDTVLDFCMGSGSTGVACLNTGRNFIGIELDQKYFEVAKQRIESKTE